MPFDTNADGGTALRRVLVEAQVVHSPGRCSGSRMAALQCGHVRVLPGITGR
jgi:hypothetical protein